MITLLSGFTLILLAFLALALQRLYSSIPHKELKRLSVRGDELARVLYRVAAYGTSLRAFLWLVAGVAMSAGLLLVVPNVSGIVGFGVLVLTLLIAFVWLPSLRLTVHTAHLAAWVSPVIVWLVRHAHPVLERAASLINRGRVLSGHSHLYEKEDLTDLLNQQKDQPDNRISPEELDLVHRALKFGDKCAADVAQPRKQIHIVNADDAIGPILLDQLHKSGQSSFLVYKDDKETIVGSLLMRDAVNARAGGRVFDLIRSDLCYVHEDFSLSQVLTAFQKTGHHTAIVVNSFEEFVGVITLDAILQELVGMVADNANLNYESPSAIAAYQPQEDVPKQVTDEKPDTPAEDLRSSPEATGVVE